MTAKYMDDNNGAIRRIRRYLFFNSEQIDFVPDNKYVQKEDICL
jgi:antirestriction protein ArdC